MPRGKRKECIENAAKENQTALTPLEIRRVLAVRIDKTAALLCEMLEELHKHGAKEELLKRAQQCLDYGILAALWSLDMADDNGKVILIS